MARLRRAPIAKGDPADLQALKARAHTVFSARDDMIDEARALRFMENTPDVPAEIEADIVRTPQAYQLIERMTGTLTVDPPHISVPPRDQTQGAMTAASQLERATTALLHELVRQQDSDVFERFIECLLADGWGAMRLMYTPQVWGGYPKQEKGETEKEYNARAGDWVKGAPLPINWAWLDPKTVYPFWSELGLAYVLEIDQRDPLTLGWERYNVLNAQLDNVSIEELTREHVENGAVEFAQLWTQETLTYWVNGEVAHHQKHAYRRPPYTVGRGISTSVPEPAKSGLSILYPLRHILPYLDRLLSQRASAVRLWCWPTPLLRLSEASFGQGSSPREIEIAPGKLVTLFPGEELSFLAWQGNAGELDNMTGIVMNMAERAGLSSVMYGDASSGDSGYLVNQLIAAARMKFKPIVNHAERAMEQLVQLLWDVVEHQIQRPLYVYERGPQAGWIALDPDDLQGYRQVNVTVNPLMPTDTYARSSRVIAELNAGLRSVSSAMEEIGIEQPDEMMDAIRLDRWLARPEVEEVLTAEILERYGVLRQIQARQKAMTGGELMENFGALPPALQQALAMQQMQMPGPTPGQAPGIMAAPGVAGIPPTPQPTGAQLGVRPSGVGTGQAPGPQQRGLETRR